MPARRTRRSLPKRGRTANPARIAALKICVRRNTRGEQLPDGLRYAVPVTPDIEPGKAGWCGSPVYLLPGATEVPKVRIYHRETPSPYTAFGIKGMGEGGAIAPPAVIVNAVNDALRGFGVQLSETPLTPRRLLAALERARGINKPATP